MSSMEIIITGSTGFVGQNLKEYFLGKGDKIVSLGLRDINWKQKVSNSSTAIIHLAGKAHDTTNTSSSDEYFRVNRDLTIELFDHFLGTGIRDFFYFSSVKAVADSVDDILREDTVPNPLTPYGVSKYEAEEYLLSQVLPEGKRLFIIRPCMIHGPGNKGNLNLLYKICEKGIPWPLAAFPNKRSFLSIDNLSFLINEMIGNTSVKSGIYNYADDQPVSTNELVTLIARSQGKKGRLWHVPPQLVRLIVKIGDILPLPLNSERLKKLTESYVVSNSKIKTELRILELPLSSIQGLEKTIKSFQKS